MCDKLESYFELVKQNEKLLSKLEPLAVLDRELTTEEDQLFYRICDEMDSIFYEMRGLMSGFLHETDGILLNSV